MRVLEHIKSFVALMAILVVFSAPIAAAGISHACCPDVSATEEKSKTDNLVAHFQHLDSGTPNQHAHGDELDADPAASNESPCEIASCMNAFSSIALNSGTFGSPSWSASSQASFPAIETAVSAADNLHTPPPRLS